MKLVLNTPELLVWESALFRTVTTLLIGPRHLVLFDPNWLPEEISAIRKVVDDRKAGKDCYLVFTHSDYDHIIGYGGFPEFTIIASAAFTRQPKQAEIVQEIADFDDQYYIERDYPIAYPTVDKVVEGDGESMVLGGEHYVFYQAPGHNDDGLLIFNQDRGVLLVGDYLSEVEFPYVYHSVAQYRNTLDKIEKLLVSEKVYLLISGHGDPARDLADMRRRIMDSRHYLDLLENSVRTGAAFDLDRLFQRYRFPKIMRTYHEGNQRIMTDYVNGESKAC